MMLKLDIDGKKINWQRIRAVKEIFKLKIDIDKSRILRTKKGHHIYLAVKNDLNDEFLCFLQCAMGDDYKRSCLNMNRIKFGERWQKDTWNVLFSKKFYVDTKGKTTLASEEMELDNEILRRKLK